jgi:hypothetical protein
MHGGNAGLGSGGDAGMERAGEQDDCLDEKVEGDEEKTSHEMEGSYRKERRLDDFWSMTLNR